MIAQINFITDLVDTQNIFLLIDGAQEKSFLPLLYELEGNPSWLPLYMNTDFEPILEVSPCLVQVARDSKLLEWFFSDNIEEKAGIIIVSQSTLQEVCTHLQGLLEAKLPNHDIVLFRFYSPKVLSSYAETLNQQKINYFLGVCEHFIWYYDGKRNKITRTL